VRPARPGALCLLDFVLALLCGVLFPKPNRQIDGHEQLRTSRSRLGSASLASPGRIVWQDGVRLCAPDQLAVRIDSVAGVLAGTKVERRGEEPGGAFSLTVPGSELSASSSPGQ